MRPNIGIVNALIRITCGLTMLSWATSKLVKRPWSDRYLIVAMLGGMKVGEGITRFCPLTALFQQYKQNAAQSSTQHQLENKSEPVLPINPT